MQNECYLLGPRRPERFFLRFYVINNLKRAHYLTFNHNLTDVWNHYRCTMLLFRIAAGETWLDGVAVTDDDGNVNLAIGLYVVTFIVTINWTLLQVRYASKQQWTRRPKRERSFETRA